MAQYWVVLVMYIFWGLRLLYIPWNPSADKLDAFAFQIAWIYSQPKLRNSSAENLFVWSSFMLNWGQILGRNPDRSFLLAIHIHHYTFALRFLFLQTHATSYSFCKGERRKTWQKIIPSFLWFKKSIQKPQGYT
jgi:hypothetical protein